MEQTEIQEILSSVDHTLLRVDSTWEEIREVLDDAIKYQTASACIPPSFVKRAAEYVDGRLPICTVIGFPNGYSTTLTKCFEAKDAIQNGATEIDMVINIGWVKEGRYDAVLDEINLVKEVCQGRLLKVIIEICLLTKEEIEKMCQVVSNSLADFIKTSTGFSVAGAKEQDIEIMAEHMSRDKKIKAAGGIASMEDAKRFLQLGADRLGTSRVVAAVKMSDNTQKQ